MYCAMKADRTIITIFLITISSFFFNHINASAFPPDSLRTKWIEGRKYILYKIEPKETWSLLARRYNLSVDDLKESNMGVEVLKIGQIINIPAEQGKSEVLSNKPVPEESGIHALVPVYYTVKLGETLYSIAKRFEQSVDDLKSRNKLKSHNLSEGQKLIIRYINRTAPAGTPVIKAESNTVSTSTDEAVKATNAKPGTSTADIAEIPTKLVSPIKKNSDGRTLMQVSETGIAAWIKDNALIQDKYYGLHRTVPTGTIIKVINRMNNQHVYVKIVGSLPDTGENDNIIIKVSQAVSEKLNALDPVFRVELSYGILQ